MPPLRVFVTGGGRGIGRAIALRFAREGAHVAIAARHSDQLDSVVAEIEAAGGKGIAAQMNVMEHGGVEAAVWRVLQFTGGTLDVLVNNAGIFQPRPFREIDRQNWQMTLDVNLTGAFYVTSEAIDALLQGERPHLVNMASEAAQQGFAGSVAYCASKYGLRGFSDAMRAEYAERGLRVSTIYPGATDTTIFEGVPGEWDRSTMTSPEDVAEVIWNAYNAPAGASVDDLEVPKP